MRDETSFPRDFKKPSKTFGEHTSANLCETLACATSVGNNSREIYKIVSLKKECIKLHIYWAAFFKISHK